MKNRSIIIIITLIIFNVVTSEFLASCSPNKGVATKELPSELDTDLENISLSENLNLESTLHLCDENVTIEAADPTFEKNVDKVPEFWSRCQKIYSCSDYTSERLRGWFQNGARFNLGFAEFKNFKSKEVNSTMRGLFNPRTQNIYLDTRLTNLFEACAVLFHELTHRFDEQVAVGDRKFETEYRAYYNQTRFSGEIEGNKGDLGEFLKAGGTRKKIDFKEYKEKLKANKPVVHSRTTYQITREDLLNTVSESLGETVDSSIIKKFDPFPWESN